VEHPLLQQRAVDKIELLLVTADRGLAGAYTATSSARRPFRSRHGRNVEQKQLSIVAVGRKGRDWTLRHGPPLRAEFTGIGDRPSSNDIAPVASVVIEDFIAGYCDAVYVAFYGLSQHAAPGAGHPAAAADRAFGARSARRRRLYF